MPGTNEVLNKKKRRSLTLEAKKKALEIAARALEKQAQKVVILNIKKLSSVSDYLLICSADSERQVEAIADEIEDGLKKKGERALGVEGAAEGRWALLDFNDVVVHVFLDRVRGYYDLEGLWAEAPLTEVKDKVKKAVTGEKPKARPKKTAVKKTRSAK